MGLRRAGIRTLLAAAVVATAWPPSRPVLAQAARPVPLQVVLSHATVITIPDYAWIQVGDPKIADIEKRPNNLFVVFGYKVGTTNLLVYNNEGQRILDRDIVVVPDSSGAVTVTRATTPSDYACVPNCVPQASSASAVGGGAPGAPPGAGPGATPTAAAGYPASGTPNAINPLAPSAPH